MRRVLSVVLWLVVLGAFTADSATDTAEQRRKTRDALALYHAGEISEDGLIGRMIQAGNTKFQVRTYLDQAKISPSTLYRYADRQAGKTLWRHTVKDGSDLEWSIFYACQLEKVIRPTSQPARP